MPRKPKRDGQDFRNLASDVISKIGQEPPVRPAGARFCVYAHSIGREVFYVGQGSEKRPYEFCNRNEMWRQVVGSNTRKVGRERVTVTILGWFTTSLEALAAESATIRLLWPVANGTRLTQLQRKLRRQRLVADAMRLIETGAPRSTSNGRTYAVSVLANPEGGVE